MAERGLEFHRWSQPLRQDRALSFKPVVRQSFEGLCWCSHVAAWAAILSALQCSLLAGEAAKFCLLTLRSMLSVREVALIMGCVCVCVRDHISKPQLPKLSLHSRITPNLTQPVAHVSRTLHDVCFKVLRNLKYLFKFQQNPYQWKSICVRTTLVWIQSL